MVAESRTGALRACVQEHVDVTLNEVGEQAFDIILRDVSPEYRNIFVKLYNQVRSLPHPSSPNSCISLDADKKTHTHARGANERLFLSRSFFS